VLGCVEIEIDWARMRMGMVVRVEFESEFEFEGFVDQTGEPFIQIGLAYCLRSVTVAITSHA
jgi:hypothetical protein